MYKKHIYTDDSYFFDVNKLSSINGSRTLCIKEKLDKIDLTNDFGIEFRWYYGNFYFSFPFFFYATFQSSTHIMALRHTNSDRLTLFENIGGSFPNSLLVNGLNALQGTWIHIVCTWEQGVEQRVYVNGVKSSRVATSTGLLQENFSEFTLMGANQGSNVYSHDGKFKGFRVFNTSINDSEAAELYGNQKEIIQPVPASLTSNLIREKLLNQKNGLKAIDTYNPYYTEKFINYPNEKNFLKGSTHWKNQ